MKNFNPGWSDKKVRALFSKFGKIRKLVLIKEENKEDGIDQAEAFITYARILISVLAKTVL